MPQLRLLVLALFFACTRMDESKLGPETATTPAQRIVVLGPSTTANLFAMQQGHRIVGVSDYCITASAKNIARVGGLADPSLERIVGLDPDLVLAQGNIPRVQQLCENSGVAYHAFATDTLQEWNEEVAWLGQRLHAEKNASDLRTKLNDGLASLTSGSTERPSVLLVIFRSADEASKIMVAGDRGFLDELLTAAGGRNVLDGSARDYFDLNEERLLRAAPEWILEFNTDAKAEDRERLNAEALAIWQRDFPSLPAVQAGRVFTLTGEDLLIPGPSMLTTAKQMQRLLNAK